MATHRNILTFNRTKLPSLIKLASWHHEIVEQYIPTPLRCVQCLRIGHTKNCCRRTKASCAKAFCSSRRPWLCSPWRGGNVCIIPLHCMNCGGAHQSSSRDCDIYKFRCEILATQAHITCNEAADEVRDRFRSERKTYSL